MQDKELNENVDVSEETFENELTPKIDDDDIIRL